jgi:hypothetical protein
MNTRNPSAALAIVLGVGVGIGIASWAATLGGCNRRSLLEQGTGEGAGARDGEGSTTGARSGAAIRPPAGTSCTGREDCPSDQACIEQRCRFRETSVATAARGQVEAGDWEGAIRTYDQALEQFAAVDAPVPSEILCGSASLILRTASDGEARERGASRADLCFRSSLPGAPEREEVRGAVARLRFEGLDTALFDRPEPAESFFTRDASRPTIDALAIDAQLPESEEPGAAQIREQLTAEGAHRAIAECFVSDWELRHEREARANLIVRYSTRLHDMGTYDVYQPEITIEKTTVAEDGFEPCVARALTGAVTAPRASRVVAWQSSLEIIARVQ